MKTFAEARAISEKLQDGFYLSAFMLQAWIGKLLLEAASQYAEKKDPRDRSLQSGQSLLGFNEIFPRPPDSDLPHILSDLLRFAEHDDPMAALLSSALVPLSLEHDSTGDYIGPKTKDAARRPKDGAALVLRSIARWCDWLDAGIHLQTHAFWHFAPACFDPDPDKRELALLGTIQRHVGDQSESARAHWQWHFGDAAERFKDSPKWPTLGKAMSSQSDRLWPYRNVDTIIISLWPLVKKHNWTYHDLLHTAREIRSASSGVSASTVSVYPLDTEQSLATYCTNVLGLSKKMKGTSAKPGKPPGHNIALRLFIKSSSSSSSSS